MRAPLLLSLLVPALLAAGCGDGDGGPSLNRNAHAPIHGWILLDDDRAHVSEVLALAGQHGVTPVQLSHSLIMDVEEITEDATRAAFLRDIAQEAKGYGLEVVFWAHGA